MGKLQIRLVLSHSICFAANKRRRSGGRLDDVMSDLSALSIAAYFVQCRESRAAKARKGGVDAFGETSAGPCGRFAVRASHSADLTLSAQAHFQSEAALCQTKRNTLPGEGRERRILLSISINLDKNYFDKINKNKNFVYFGKRQPPHVRQLPLDTEGRAVIPYRQ